MTHDRVFRRVDRPQNAWNNRGFRPRSHSSHFLRFFCMSAAQQTGDLAAIRERLRGAGLRCTSARLAVMRELAGAGSPVSHAEIADKLAPFGLDKATVFR